MSKLVIVNDNKLGSRPVMVKSAARSDEPRLKRAAVTDNQHVQLSYGAPKKRVFPAERKTVIDERDTRPQLWSNKLHAVPENGYTNSYSSSTMNLTTREGIVNNVILYSN